MSLLLDYNIINKRRIVLLFGVYLSVEPNLFEEVLELINQEVNLLGNQ